MEYILIKTSQCDGNDLNHNSTKFVKTGDTVWIARTENINLAFKALEEYSNKFKCGCKAEVRECE